MAKFKKGDICIGQHLTAHSQYNNVECEILAVYPAGTYALDYTVLRIIHVPAVAYVVEWADRRMLYVHESCLRKKPPREEGAGSWDVLAKLGWKTAQEQVRKEREKQRLLSS